MQNAIAEKLSENPVIAAVAEPECLPHAQYADSSSLNSGQETR